MFAPRVANFRTARVHLDDNPVCYADLPRHIDCVTAIGRTQVCITSRR